ncbi:hypothetical protein NMY22_g14057 [Coprinellus aureogranulatus]|nr:hypothetical protein NMY22_g14057 [Coprinellus aureogranulatus]
MTKSPQPEAVAAPTDSSHDPSERSPRTLLPIHPHFKPRSRSSLLFLRTGIPSAATLDWQQLLRSHCDMPLRPSLGREIFPPSQIDFKTLELDLETHNILAPICNYTIYSYITSPSRNPLGPAWRVFSPPLKLTISPIPWEHWHVYDSYAHCLGRLPRGLKSLSLSVQPYDTPLDFEPQFYRKPFATLTHLALNCMWNAPIVVPNLVRNCVNLETLRLHFICGDADSAGQAGQPVEGSKLILPKLHTLELHNVEPYMADMADMADMLRELLQLSTLAHVTIKCTSIRVSDKLALWNPLDGLRLRSPSQGARLHFLELGRMKLDFTALTDVFVNLPFLEHLLLERVTFDTRDSELVAIGLKRFRIGAVDSTLQDQPILPRLTRLELREIEGGSSTHAFLEYIQLRALRFRELREVSGEDSNSRWNGNDELRRITIKYHLWSEETKADWENCSSIVSNLRRDFGLVVERMVNESEWLDFTGNQYASVGESGNGEDDRQ